MVYPQHWSVTMAVILPEEELMKRNGIKHVKVAPYHPASNGLAERAVRVFKEGFEKMGEGSIQTKISPISPTLPHNSPQYDWSSTSRVTDEKELRHTA